MTSPNANLDVEPEALSAFAGASRGRAEQFRQLRQSFSDGHVPRHSFGVMPASFSLAAAYAEQFEACLAGLADGAELMADIAEGLDDTAGAYTGSDVANRALFVPGGGASAPGPTPSPSPRPAPTPG
ncbi:WXG100 family type VII secretion target [Micromonospora sp. DT233]|uniref:WXG100 family type VII secretion target n=1 Tax=Micromonospora sp. DT233 TaxID=3393432 RepID=UPI003CE82C51